MKIQITFKDPDAVIECIQEAVDAVPSPDGISEEEMDSVRGKRCGEIIEMCGKWFKYGEYLTVEVDTEAETCIVLEAK